MFSSLPKDPYKKDHETFRDRSERSRFDIMAGAGGGELFIIRGKDAQGASGGAPARTPCRSSSRVSQKTNLRLPGAIQLSTGTSVSMDVGQLRGLIEVALAGCSHDYHESKQRSLL